VAPLWRACPPGHSVRARGRPAAHFSVTAHLDDPAAVLVAPSSDSL
jgi:hypothetical protein